MFEKLIEQYAYERAGVIDRALKEFLTEQGIPCEDVAKVKAAFKKGGLELIQEHTKTDTQEVYTFKLCRVYAQKSINIPIIHLTSPN